MSCHYMLENNACYISEKMVCFISHEYLSFRQFFSTLFFQKDDRVSYERYIDHLNGHDLELATHAKNKARKSTIR